MKGGAQLLLYQQHYECNKFTICAQSTRYVGLQKSCRRKGSDIICRLHPPSTASRVAEISVWPCPLGFCEAAFAVPCPLLRPLAPRWGNGGCWNMTLVFCWMHTALWQKPAESPAARWWPVQPQELSPPSAAGCVAEKVINTLGEEYEDSTCFAEMYKALSKIRFAPVPDPLPLLPSSLPGR